MSANLRAFLYLIRWCEGTSGEDGYRIMFGGERFESFNDHPRKAITKSLGGKPITSTAAGAYQFLSKTWDECVRALNLYDFGPESQDKAATYLISRRGALQAVEDGRLEEAIRLCNREWASLPGSPYGQPVKTLEQCRHVFTQAGGTLATPEPSTQPDEAPMIPAFLAAALPALIDAAPSLIRIFGKGKQSETNAQAAEKVAEIAKAVTGATTEQEAVQKIAADPAVKEAFQQRIREQWFELQEAGGGGIAAARDFGLKSSETPMYRQPALLISLVLLVPVFMLLSDVFYVHPDAYSGELRVQIVTAVLTIIGLVAAYWLGSSMSSRTKDEIIAGKRD